VKLVIAVIIVLFAVPVFADHLQWMQGDRGVHGESCCNDLDCVPADATLLDLKRGHVRVNGVDLVVPKESIHVIKDDSDGYWCYQLTTRCQPPELELSPECERCVYVKRVGGHG
jgi:hypothetical protein